MQDTEYLQSTESKPGLALRKPERRLLLCSTGESLTRGQVSLLAILEIILATWFFWWLGKISPWPWLTLIGLMAAPVLLLRSPQSIEAGQALLGRYFEDQVEGRKPAYRSSLILGTIDLACISALSYVLAQRWLLGMMGANWTPYVVGAIVTVLVGVIAIAMAIAVAGSVAVGDIDVDPVAFPEAYANAVAAVSRSAGEFAGAGAFAIPAAFALAGASFSIIAGAYGVAFWFVVAFSGVASAAVPRSIVKTASIVVLPSAILGVCARATAIRFWATISYFRTGLLEFPRNWFETVFVIDCLHLPELLPKAGEVRSYLDLKRLLGKEGVPSSGYFDFLFKLVLALLIYIPTLLYRWNIKASTWIWLPVALILRPAVWLDDEDLRNKSAFWTTWHMQSLMALAVAGLCAWLLMPFLPDSLIKVLPDWLRAVNSRLPAPTVGVRYVMLWVLVLSLLGLLYSAYQIRAPHAKALEAADTFHRGYDANVKARFRGAATQVRRWLQWNTAVAALTIWVFSLSWALQAWPDQLNHVVWNWVRPLL